MLKGNDRLGRVTPEAPAFLQARSITLNETNDCAKAELLRIFPLSPPAATARPRGESDGERLGVRGIVAPDPTPSINYQQTLCTP